MTDPTPAEILADACDHQHEADRTGMYAREIIRLNDRLDDIRHERLER